MYSNHRINGTFKGNGHLTQRNMEKQQGSWSKGLIRKCLAIGIYTVFIVQIVLAFVVHKREGNDTIVSKESNMLTPHRENQVESLSENTPVTSFVCINGQLERLELENKLETLLNPIRQDIGGSVDIALILTDNEAIYTKAYVSEQRAKHQPAFHTYQEATEYLTSRGFNVVTKGPVNHSKNPTVYREYLQRLAQLAGPKKINDPEFYAYDKRRAQNHVRQAIAGEQCYRAMMSSGRDYSKGIVARWRDDVGFLNRLDITKFHNWLKDPPPVDEEYDLAVYKENDFRPTLVTPFCRNWQGLNDRGAFVHPQGAYKFFMAPLAAFGRAQELPSDRVCNHERFLRHIYNQEGFLFIPTKDLYPVPMFVNEGKGVFREEEKIKQLCRVWWKSYRPDCPRQNETIQLLDSTTASTPSVVEEQKQPMSLPDSKSNVTSFVCINGQLERLELENKFKNLLLPIREDIGGTVDIALVVSENEALYTKAEVSQQRAEHVPAFKKYQEAVDFLTERGFNVVTKEPSSHSVDPMVYPEYQQRLAQLANDYKIKTPELFVYNKKRAQNHVRQAISGEECYRHMLSTKKDYSKGIVARWRDDVGFEERLDVAKIFGQIHDPPPIKEKDDWGVKKPFRPTMVTPHCRNWNGLNDRGAFIHPAGAYAYFMAPLVAFSSALSLPSARVCNYERFLRYVYNQEGFHYVPSRQLYPIPMYNNNGTGVFRTKEVEKLCLAFWNSWTADCPRSNETITLLA